jgi:hypothetical protein
MGPLSPAARKPYHPGQLSHEYWKLAPPLRQQLNDLADILFAKKTGVERKIDEHNPADRMLLRQWLLIRDAVMSWYLYNKLLRDDHARELGQQIEAGMQRERLREEEARSEAEARRLGRDLAEYVEHSGLPEKVDGSLLNTILQAAHTIHFCYDLIEALEIMDKLLPHSLHLLEFPLTVVGAVLGMPLAVVAGLSEIAEENEAGDRDAERNAFRYGFASELVYGRIRNSLPSNWILGRKQLLGQRAAQVLLQSLKPNVREKFLAAYQGPERHAGENIAKALHDVGAR